MEHVVKLVVEQIVELIMESIMDQKHDRFPPCSFTKSDELEFRKRTDTKNLVNCGPTLTLTPENVG